MSDFHVSIDGLYFYYSFNRNGHGSSWQDFSMAFALFWFLRMVEQVVFFGIKNSVSLLLAFAFLVGSIIYLLPVLIIG